MKGFSFSPNNPYKDMPEEDFIALLQDAGFEVASGTGKITAKDEMEEQMVFCYSSACSTNFKHGSTSFTFDSLPKTYLAVKIAA